MMDTVAKTVTSKKNINEYLKEESQKTQLKFLTCGSVDDGKSTLIGRLLFETGSVPESELKMLAKDSQKFGTTDNQYDFALLVDGLSSEREQGITIDVAYRYFATSKRKFIVADTLTASTTHGTFPTRCNSRDCEAVESGVSFVPGVPHHALVSFDVKIEVQRMKPSRRRETMKLTTVST